MADFAGFYQKRWLHCLIIAIIGALSYSGTLNSPFLFDDVPNIVDNPAVKDLSYYTNPKKADELGDYDSFKNRVAGKDVFGRRIVGYLTFAINYKVHGLDARGYHAANLIIHIINALLVYALASLLLRVSGGISRELGDFLPLFSALVFISHPVQTQAVTYIVQRFASLAAMFYLSAVILYMKFRSSGKILFYLLAIAASFLAIKTKETAFTIPVVLACTELFFFRANGRQRLLFLSPFALLSIVFAANAFGSSAAFQGSASEYLFTQFRVVVTYVRLIFLPVGQNLYYDYPIYKSFFDAKVMLSAAFLLSIAAFGAYSYRFNKLVSFGIFWFFIALSVESSIIPIADVIFEHRVYLPSVGAIIAITSGIGALVRKKSVFILIMALIVSILSIAAVSRNRVWADETLLWEDVVKKSPGLFQARNNLGNAYLSKGRANQAEAEFTEAVRLAPGFAQGYYNLAVIYASRGESGRAKKYFETALGISPDFANAHNNLASIYYQEGNRPEAMRHYSLAVRLMPRLAEAHYNLGLLYAQSGDLASAKEAFESALRARPDYPEAKKALEALE